MTKKMPKLTSLRLASRRSTSATCMPTGRTLLRWA